MGGIIGGTEDEDIIMGSHHLEKARVLGGLAIALSGALSSTVTCMMMHVKDRGADRYHD